MSAVGLKVAAFQTPLLPPGSMQAIDSLPEIVARCEADGVEILCYPEGVLGGLADYAPRPAEIAIDVQSGRLDEVLAPLASDSVTSIVGFTESDGRGGLYNAAAVFHRGTVAGIYRKLYPAINRSVYRPGDAQPVFTIGELTFGILICRDSNFAEPARRMASRGATVLFVPTNNGLPPEKGGEEVVGEARTADIARAVENGVYVVRADVAGSAAGLVSYGSSGVVDPQGRVVVSAQRHEPDLIVADIPTRRRTAGSAADVLPV